MKRTALVLGLAGLAVATTLVVRAGLGTVVAALATAGLGLVWASLVHVVPMALNARAWQLLAGRRRGRTLAFFTFVVWVREAVNGLLPVARVGGEVASARLLVRRGVPGPQAGASIVADMTVSLVTQLVFTLGGIAVLAARAPGGPLVRTAWISAAAAVPIVVVLVIVQRAGAAEILARVARALAGRWMPEALVGGARRLDRATAAVYRSRGRILRCAAWQLAGWAAGAAEIWTFLAFAGSPVRFTDALALESIVQALSSAAFVVPGALGVQEGAFVAVGGALGLGAETALAAALARRARDLIVFVPALVVWQWQEARAVLARRAIGEGDALP
ncbi:lysylphosphatidylglycerol synthase domain-containing protein [Anaeromyxobacter oryzisoli]|uniref:lysylphosphatidylglycerol synthase domain-containing protein n=1 Tax=Anaeromyxobacter oryzisoli TaxID=2925408 RepID=UPI001F581841|nr:lysylphosphatidylglycerol synthase domain-containing protein [Anaeromyxobacter sp. SG63]